VPGLYRGLEHLMSAGMWCANPCQVASFLRWTTRHAIGAERMHACSRDSIFIGDDEANAVTTKSSAQRTISKPVRPSNDRAGLVRARPPIAVRRRAPLHRCLPESPRAELTRCLMGRSAARSNLRSHNQDRLHRPGCAPPSLRKDATERIAETIDERCLRAGESRQPA
jgi:hypothetical protein